ncbi:zinc finger BED domain-containing protein RICESLEEPER 2-like [Tasmannia lanceolata]|uniref:zinc finger BED domain-containing protein RICESLEEPER 2-like n=1 Tax=Tasmannia lanceolata TaxID=3420 RepID=UPI004063DF5F
MGLRMDVPTRWNSTFFMLECAIKFRTAFVHYDLVEMGYIYCPSEEEWERGVKIAKFLKPFAEMTNLVSGSEYPTANLYFICVWRIQLRLFEEMMCEDEVISDMAQNMYPKFEKYWDSYSIVLAMAVVLDPRYKFEFVRFCYNKIDSHTAEGKVSFLKGKLFSLFQEYVDQYSTHDKDTTSVGTNGTHSFTDDICEYDYYRKRRNVSKKSELDLYLEEPDFDPKEHQVLDILEYWRSNRSRYPILCKMARDIMSIPITTVASESAFSIGAKVLTKYRSTLSPDNAQALICSRNWLFGYEVQSEGPSDDQLMVKFFEDGTSETRDPSIVDGMEGI